MNEFPLDLTSAFDLSSLRGALEETLPDTVLARRVLQATTLMDRYFGDIVE